MEWERGSLGAAEKNSASGAPKMSLLILIPESKGISPHTAKGALQNVRKETIIDFGGWVGTVITGVLIRGRGVREGDLC